MEPKISIIVPCFNQAHYLPKALDSILQQTYGNWECIIINDGSPDKTAEVVEKYLKADSRFKYISQENKGLSVARNAGLKAATGEFIQFLDADDYLDSAKFSSLINQLSNRPELDLIISNFLFFDEQTKKCTEPYWNLNRTYDLESIIKDWDNEYTIPIHCAIFKRSLLLKGFNEELKAKEDWLMWVDVFRQRPTYSFYNMPHAFYRLHTSSMTKDYLHMQTFTIEVFKVLYNRFSEPHLKDLVFDRFFQYYKQVFDKDKQIINDKDGVIDFLKTSYTYKLGNAILYPFKKIRNYISRKLLC